MKKTSTLLRSLCNGSSLGRALLLATTLFFGTLNAQSIFSIVGNGTTSNSSTGYPAPFGNWYYGSHHQMRVTAAELIGAGMSPGANITSVGFNIASINGAANMQNWQVTVYTTTATDPLVSGYLTTGAVSTSTFTTVNGVVGWWQTQIAPYVWNGTDNLVIETCQTNPGGFTYNYSTMWTTTLSGPEIKCRYNYQDLVTSCPTNASSTSSTTRPDIRFEWNYLSPCAGMPTNNSVITPTFQICANVPYGAIGLASTYTTSGLTYQWMQSTLSAVGPYTPVPSNGTGWTYSVPGLTTTTYYQAVITCTNSSQTYTTPGSAVQVAATVTDNVPYGESFDNIGQPNRLPNCSWFAANQGTTVKTYTSSQSGNRLARTGIGFATFSLPSTQNSIYTNGIYMVPGITYSAAAYYSTEYFGYTNWSNLSLLVGPSQTVAGQFNVATAAPAASGPYKLLSGTFTVSSAGIYYVCVRATGVNGSAAYLNIDDISVTIPCTPASGNNPTLTLSSSAGTICAGDQINLNASGASSYSWNTGDNTPVVVSSPASTYTYVVTGTNALTGCSTSMQQIVTVNSSPTVLLAASKLSVCPGETTYLTALGANSFAWSNGGTGAVIAVSPAASITYSAIGTGLNGCSNTATIGITVKQAPSITANSSSNGADVCLRESITLSGNGGATYQWMSSASSVLYSGSPITVQMTSNGATTFTVIGTGANGCTNKTTVTQNVQGCVGITENQGTLSGLVVYPNPTSGLLNVELKSAEISSIIVTDVTGRVVMTLPASGNAAAINLDGLASGVYYAKISTDSSSAVVRVIKN